MNQDNLQQMHQTIDRHQQQVKSMLPTIPGSTEEQNRLHLSDLRQFTTDMKEKDMLTRMVQGLDPVALITDAGDAYGEQGVFLSQYILVYLDRWTFVYGQLEEEQYTTNGFLAETNRIAFTRSDYATLSDDQFLTQMISVLKLGLSGQIGIAITTDENKMPLGSLLWLEDERGAPFTLDAVWLNPSAKAPGVSTVVLKNSSLPRESLSEDSILLQTISKNADRYPRREIERPLAPSEAKQPEDVRRVKQAKTLQRFGTAAILLFVIIQLGRHTFGDNPIFIGGVCVILAGLLAYGIKAVPRFLVVAYAPILGMLAVMIAAMAIPILLYIALLSERVNDEIWGPVVIIGSIVIAIALGAITLMKLQKRFDRSVEKAFRE